MNQRALVIGIERYSAARGVPYARADAEAMAEALRELGFEVPPDAVLVDDRATKAVIESRLRTELATTTADDRFILYYAGHGVSVNGKNYLTCHDTQLTDLENTCVPLATVYGALRNAQANKVFVFLDSCHAGLEIPDAARQLTAELSYNELKDFFDRAEYCLCFSSCKLDQTAVGDPGLGHGIWTFHLLQALRGEVPNILTGSFLTASSLQNHLAVEVPRTIRQTRTKRHAQTPWLFGGASQEAMVADLTDVLARRAAKAVDIIPSARAMILRGTRKVRVRDLSGFKKRQHFTPNEITDWTREFVRTCGHPELLALQEEFFQKLRKNFGYKRRDLGLHKDLGAVAIVAPDFTLNLLCQQSETSAAEAVISFEVTELEDLDVIAREEFIACFDDVLTNLDIHTDVPTKLPELIDALEELDAQDWDVDFPADCSYCEITFHGNRHTVRFDRFTLSFIPSRAGTPLGLIEGFKAAFQELASRPELVPALSPGRQSSLPSSSHQSAS